MSKNGNRIHEPGDKPGEIGDTIFQAALDMLFEGWYLIARELLKEFGRYDIYISQCDLENLMYLREGTLYQEPKVIPFMSIKKDIE